MPLCTLHLIRLQHDNDISNKTVHARRARFLQQLLSSSTIGHRLLMACVVRRPVIVANRIDPVYLNSTKWDLLLVFKPEKGDPQTSKARQEDAPTPLSLAEHPQTKADVSAEYALDVGIPSKILDAYSERTRSLAQAASKAQGERPSTESLLSSPSRAHPGYEPKTSQLLEMSDDLVSLIQELDELADGDGLVDAKGPVQQFNLLSFKEGKEHKERYITYGQNFAKVAPKFGGEAKLLGTVVRNDAREGGTPRWDEIAIANYHSLRHFAAMAGSQDYQSINRTHRLPSLDDTSIICTQEVDLERLRQKGKARM